MPVPESFDDPGGSDIDEHRPVIRRVTGLEHPHHLHFERIHAGQVKRVLRRGYECVAGAKAELVRHRSAQDALPQDGQHTPGGDLKAAEAHVIQRGADNRKASRRVPVVNGNGESKTSLVNAVSFAHGDGLGRL